MQARARAYKMVKAENTHLAENLVDGVAGVLDVVSKLTSIPIFGACAEALRAVYTVAKDYKDNKELVARLASRCALLVKAIADRMDGRENGLREPLRTHALKFTEFLKEIANFLETVKGKPKWSRIINSSRTRKEIEELSNRLQVMVNDFQLAAALNIERWAAENDTDRSAAETASQQMLEQLLQNDASILTILEIGNARNVQGFEQIFEVLHNIQATMNISAATPRERDLLAKARTSLVRFSGGDLKESPWHTPENDIVLDETPFTSGGYGEVFVATWGGTRRVAVKRLLVKHPDEKLKALLRNEVGRWYHLRHPNILPLFGANLIAQPPFMISPYMRNGNLITYLTNHSNADRVDLLYDVACALHYLHGKGILHCDLKGFNVLVDDLGNALVADFGFATVTTRVSILSKASRPGTRRWMAPELFSERPKLSEKSDVYAFAMTAYEMYTLQVPFPTVMEDAVVPIIERGRRPNIETYEDLEDLPDDEKAMLVPMPDPIKDLVLQCWAPLPENRPTFAAVVGYLKRYHPRLSDPQQPSRVSPSAKSHPGIALSAPVVWQQSSMPGTFRKELAASPDPQPPTPSMRSAKADSGVALSTPVVRLTPSMPASPRTSQTWHLGHDSFERDMQSQPRAGYNVKERQSAADARARESDMQEALDVPERRQMEIESQRLKSEIERFQRSSQSPRELNADEKRLPQELQNALKDLYGESSLFLDLKSKWHIGPRQLEGFLRQSVSGTEIDDNGTRAIAVALKDNTSLIGLTITGKRIEARTFRWRLL
ncbi:Leucine-rich repeat serine/threonine-protein kinase 2 [Gonapodya sp. JEL0774]|nr:Leucine-rich repeat serine/threonine-protein kinase 2 [Gonapodya sp. JEL0774]